VYTYVDFCCKRLRDVADRRSYKAGEVPAIQYQITDLHHYAILGNVLYVDASSRYMGFGSNVTLFSLYIGLAVPTLCFWPLPLLHGRKPYTLMALALLMPLQFPQGLVVGAQRSPYIAGYRATLLTARLVSGIVLGFANFNFKATLLDLFGSSLQSGNPHQERVVENDVRRHGGGMGVWLGIWSWCYTGSIGVGFLLGALIIGGADPDWGFWLVMILVAFVLLLNVLTPEVRRSAYRRSVAEVLKGSQISRRVARGEIKMHISSTGPKWWWEEAHAGLVLSLRMMRQPGFTVVALYSSWIYGQIVMIVVVS
jgi:serine/arginine repetitive matrix protein 2